MENGTSYSKSKSMDDDILEIKTEFIEVEAGDTSLVLDNPIREEDTINTEDPLAVDCSLGFPAASNNRTSKISYVLWDRINTSSGQYMCPDIPEPNIPEPNIPVPNIPEDTQPSFSNDMTVENSAGIQQAGMTIWQIPYRSETVDRTSNTAVTVQTPKKKKQKKNTKKTPTPQPRTRAYPKSHKYKCEFCPKQFKTQTTLDDHEDTHPEMIKLTCKYCKKRFAQSKFVLRHVKKYHWEDEQKIKDEKQKRKQAKLAQAISKVERNEIANLAAIARYQLHNVKYEA